MNIYMELFLTFANIGLFTFGGGYAMISIIEDKCVEKKKWITHEEMMQITVIAESTPGPIAINSSTYVGYKKAGFFGAVAATIGMVLPSFVIIYIISKFLDHFLEIPVVANAFSGIKVAVGILIIRAAVNMYRKMEKTTLSKIILLCALVAMLGISIFSVKISSIVLLLVAAVASLIVAMVEGPVKAGEKGDEQS